MNEARLFDCFTFFNELDLLELRLQTLHSHVRSFVLVEATRTFTGKPKPLYFAESRDRFAPFLDRIIHVVVDDMPSGKNPWRAEAHQRNAIGRGLVDAAPNDLVLVSDVDEIPKPQVLVPALARAERAITIFGKEEHNFRLDLRVSGLEGRWGGPRMIAHRHFRSGQKLRQVRGVKSQKIPSFLELVSWKIDNYHHHGAWLDRMLIPCGAWHFSFVMNDDDVSRKLTAFSHTELVTEENLDPRLLSHRVAERRSFFGHRLKSAPLSTLPRPVQEDPARWSHMLECAAETATSSQNVYAAEVH